MKGRVTGIGGIFFKSKNPDGIAKWYQDMFGILMTPQNYDDPPWQTEAGTTVFQPFSEDTEYFGGPDNSWMMNFRVDDLDAITERLKAAGHSYEYEGEFPNGRFVKLLDPEGNAIQLWEPGGVDAS